MALSLAEKFIISWIREYTGNNFKPGPTLDILKNELGASVGQIQKLEIEEFIFSYEGRYYAYPWALDFDL